MGRGVCCTGFEAVLTGERRAATVVVVAFAGGVLLATFTGLRGLCAFACTQGERVPHAAFACFVLVRRSCCAAVVLGARVGATLASCRVRGAG